MRISGMKKVGCPYCPETMRAHWLPSHLENTHIKPLTMKQSDTIVKELCKNIINMPKLPGACCPEHEQDYA